MIAIHLRLGLRSGPRWLWRVFVVGAFMATGLDLLGQGVIGFIGHPGPYGTTYYEAGMSFRVVAPSADVPTDGMGVVGPITTPSNVPYNPTSYMFFYRYSADNYVSFGLTNGSTFGLSSVQLADPNSPSPGPVSISFKGVRGDGSFATTTFVTPGNGATSFQTYLFSSAFGSGCVRVEIHANRWAMDNLVWIPEPGGGWLLLCGLLVLARRQR
jgi:hypothetical protein